jgi:Rad3-related DNA helicase
MIDTNWSNYWAYKQKGYEPRVQQKRIIDKIVMGLQQPNIKNIIVEASVGIGKTAIAVTIGNLVPSSYILTQTKDLQKQYNEEFNLPIMKGKNNYYCIAQKGEKDDNDEYIMCDKCINLKPWPCNDCEYINTRKWAFNQKTLVLNFHYYYYIKRTSICEPRSLLIIDEAHLLESFIMSQISYGFSFKSILKHCNLDIRAIIENSDQEYGAWAEAYNWLPILNKIYRIALNRRNILLESVDDCKKNIQKEINNVDIIQKQILQAQTEKEIIILTRKKKEKQKDLNRIRKKLDNINKQFKYIEKIVDKTAFIIEEIKNDGYNWAACLPNEEDFYDEDVNVRVDFKPIFVDKFMNGFYTHGSKRLFLTGTIGSFDKFCQYHNLKKEETCFIQESNGFPKENRPIIKRYASRMNKESKSWRNFKVLNTITEIIAENKKGLIFTTSNKQTEWLCNELSEYNLWSISSNKEYSHLGMERDDVLESFRNFKDSAILVGSYIRTGVDFPGNQCEFAILFKVPYPKFDHQALKRNQRDPEWYGYRTAMELMQAQGRGVRSATDVCPLYVIDESFENFLNYHSNLLSDYFLESIVENDEYDNNFFRF